jgi:glucose/arabinose dehydrogenase
MRHIPSFFKELLITSLLTSVATATGCVRQLSNEQISGQQDIAIQKFATDFTHPLSMQPIPNDTTGRLIVLDQTGTVTILDKNGTRQGIFLDIRDRLVTLDPEYDERGLLGLAFHPDYPTNKTIYVFYSAPLDQDAPQDYSCTNHLSRFTLFPNNTVDPNSENIILSIDKPEENHNGGTIAFGPDHYLYVPLGDGGGANDVGLGHLPGGNAQNLTTLLGKILRIDVLHGTPYTIPPDNPFINRTDARPEIWAYGLRNPHKITFDKEGNHTLFASDPGQNRWEELDIITKGANYGWNIKEGVHCFDPNNANANPTNCPDTDRYGTRLTDPILEYGNAAQPGGLGSAIIGGLVYHGTDLKFLDNHYLFGDWSGTTDHAPLFHAFSDLKLLWSSEPLNISGTTDGRLPGYLLGFGTDTNDELYVMTATTMGPTGSTGTVYRLIPST